MNSLSSSSSAYAQKASMSHRAAVLLAKDDEVTRKTRGETYSEAVIACCDLFLNCFPLGERAFIEMSLGGAHE